MKNCYHGQQIFQKNVENQRKNKTAKRRSKFSQGTRYLPLTFYILNMIKYLTLAVIPVVQGVQKIAEHTWVATISASVCLLIEAMLRLWRTEEKWILYRSTNNTLMSEKRQYVTSKGIYKNANDPCEILVERVESIIDDEAHKWVATFKETKEDA